VAKFDRKEVYRWAKLAASLGFLLADRKLRKDVAKRVRSRVGDASEALYDRYEDTVDRIESAAGVLRGQTHWPSRVGAFLVGVGIGTGLGLVLAPTSGSETRDAIRDKTIDFKNRAVRSASDVASKIRSASDMPATGTEI
jgi:gas vesicle protein